MIQNRYYKLILQFIFIISCCSFSFAQPKLRVQGAAAIPTGYAEDAVSLGYGMNLNFSNYLLNSLFEISFTAGYYKFGFKENLPDYNFSFTSVPLLAGLRFNLTDYDFIPYIGLEGGIYFTEYLTAIDYGFFGISSVTTSATHWGLSPEAGFKINITPYLDIDVNTKYNRINTNYIARAYLLIQTGFTYKFQ